MGQSWVLGCMNSYICCMVIITVQYSIPKGKCGGPVNNHPVTNPDVEVLLPTHYI